MQPLSKEEIEAIERLVNYRAAMYGGEWFWPRLLYSARLGAEFVKQTQTAQEDK